jgi:hypothetical protein
MTTLKTILVPALAAFVGCAVGVTMPVLQAQQAGAQQPVRPTGPQAWLYECDTLGAYGNYRPFNQMLNDRAQQGWELVGFVGDNREQGDRACFRRHR